MPEHPPLGKYFIAGFDQGDADHPIVKVRLDTRAGGYQVEPDYTPCPGRIPGLDLSNHILTDIEMTGGDQFAYWTYRILPGPRTYGYDVDEGTGIGTIKESHVIRVGPRGGVDYPVARSIVSTTFSSTATVVLSTATVVAPGTSAVVGATLNPTGGTQSTTVALLVLTTQVATASVVAAGSGYTSDSILTFVNDSATFTEAATFTPTLKVVGGSILAAGTLLTGLSALTLTGGTFSAAAQFTPTSLTLGAATITAAGTGYQSGDTVRAEGNTATTKATLTVGSVGLVSMTLNAPGTGITVGQVLTLQDDATTLGTATVAKVQAVATPVIVAAGTAMVAGTTVLTLVGGTGTHPTVTVTHTKVVGTPTIAVAGSGYTDGTQTFTVDTGTGTQATVSILVTGGIPGGAVTLLTAGDYTVNPTLAGSATTGPAGSGLTLNLVMGALTVALTTGGALTVVGGTYTSTGGGNDATLTISSYGVSAAASSFTISAVAFTGANPSAITCLGADPTFSAPVFGILTLTITGGGTYTAVAGAAFTTTTLTGSGTGLTFNGTFGALAGSITTAGSYTVTSETLTHASNGFQWTADYGVLSVAKLTGGSYTVTTTTCTTTTGGGGTGCTLGTIAYGVATVSVTAGAFSVYPAGVLTDAVTGATFTPGYASTSPGSSGGKTIVGVSSTSGFQTGFDVTFSGTNSVPSLNGTYTATVIDGTHFSVPAVLLSASTTGTVQLAAEIHRQVQIVNRTYSIQNSSQVDVTTLASAARTLTTLADWQFENKCLGVEQFLSSGASASYPEPGSVEPLPANIEFSHGFSYNPGVTVRMSGSPRLKLSATVNESYSYGSPTVIETPLRIFLSNIEILKIGGSFRAGKNIAINDDGSKVWVQNSVGYSVDYATDTVPACLTGSTFSAGAGIPAIGIPTVAIRCTPSSPTTYSHNQTFISDVDVSRGTMGLVKKVVVRLTTPATGGPQNYFVP